jgi:hypothetical protein
MDRAAETLSDATLANTSRRRDSEASIVDRPLGVESSPRDAVGTAPDSGQR